MNVSQVIKTLEKTITKLKTFDPLAEIIGTVDQGGYSECSMPMDFKLKVSKVDEEDCDGPTVEVIIDIAFTD